MKKILLSIICCNVFFFISNAQLEKTWGDPHAVEKFNTATANDPAYLKFQKEFKALVRNCKGTNTNAAAIKKLFTDNRGVFTTLYTGAGMKPSKPMSANRVKRTTHLVATYKNLTLKNIAAVGMKDNFLPPYDMTFRSIGMPIANDPAPYDTTGSSFTTGKMIAIVQSAPSIYKDYLGIYGKGYVKKIKFTNNPEVLAARIEFHYSFDYTGWDTYGAKTAVDLIFRTSTNFNSTAYGQLPASSPVHTSPTDRWKVIANLLPLDSVTTDFDEIHASTDTTFAIEGYITPGSDAEFMFGFSYPQGTNRGLNGCYHYGEFILKKITITYFKSAQ